MRMLLILLLLPGKIFAQMYFVGIGYGGFAGQYKNVNYVIDRYNETRNYLDNEMENIKTLSGLTWHGAYLGPMIYFDMDITGRRAYSMAYGIDNSGLLMQRNLRMKTTTWGANMGVGSFPVYLCAGLSGGMTQIATKIGQRNKIETLKYVRINRDAYADLPIFLTYLLPFKKEGKSSLGLQFKAGARIPLSKSDVSKMNEEINQATYRNDPGDRMLARHTNYEFTVILGFFGIE